MKQLTIMGRGEDWTECEFKTNELWGTVTCLLMKGLGDKPFTKVFAFDTLRNGVYNGKQYTNYALIKAVEIAKERKIPVVGEWEYADERYPKRGILFDLKAPYLRNSISHMMAMAIHQKYERIFLYGIGGRERQDYSAARNYMIFWHGVAVGRNIDLRLGNGAYHWLYKNNIVNSMTIQEILEWHNGLEKEDLYEHTYASNG